MTDLISEVRLHNCSLNMVHTLFLTPILCAYSKTRVKKWVKWSHSIVSDSLWPYGLQDIQASLSITNFQSLLKLMSIELVMPSTISSSVVPFSCLQSFPASGSFPMSQFFISGGQSIGVSALASVLSMNIQDWFTLGLTGLILQSRRLSRVFSNTTVQKHQFFGAQLSSQSNSHIHTCLLKKP